MTRNPPSVGSAAVARHGPGVASALVGTFLFCSLLIPARLGLAAGGSALRPAQVVGLAAALWWALSRALGSVRGGPDGRSVRVAIGCFAASILVSYVAAALGRLDPDELAGADRSLLALVSWVGIALVTADLLRDRASVERVLDRFVVLTAVVAVIGVIQFTTGWDPVSRVQIPGLRPTADLVFIDDTAALRRVAGTANHPIEFGVVVAVALALSLQRALRPGPHRRAWVGVTVLLGSALPMSLSRSGILAAGVALLLMASMWSARERLVVGTAVVALTVALRGVVPGLVGTITSLFASAGTDPSIQGRTDDYAVVGEYIARSPWIGRGFGTFLPTDHFYVDNQYLGTLVEAGVLGLVAVAALLVVPAVVARSTDRAVRASDPGRRDETARTLMAVLVASAAAFATFDALGFPMFSGVLFVLLGCVAALRRFPLGGEQAGGEQAGGEQASGEQASGEQAGAPERAVSVTASRVGGP